MIYVKFLFGKYIQLYRFNYIVNHTYQNLLLGFLSCNVTICQLKNIFLLFLFIIHLLEK